MEDISTQLADVFRDVFADDRLVITRSSSAFDIPGWDSLMHVTLILQVERSFGIRLSSRDVAILQSAGELQDLIDAQARG